MYCNDIYANAVFDSFEINSENLVYFIRLSRLDALFCIPLIITFSIYLLLLPIFSYDKIIIAFTAPKFYFLENFLAEFKVNKKFSINLKFFLEQVKLVGWICRWKKILQRSGKWLPRVYFSYCCVKCLCLFN